MSTMYINYMTKTYRNFLKSYEAAQKAGNGEKFPDKFSDKINEKKNQAAAVAREGVAPANNISTQDMTMEEYKEYIYDEISKLRLHPSRMYDSIAVQITDAGFEQMKNDPEYEKWVLGKLREDFAVRDPWSGMCGGSFTIHHFGAAKEEYHGEGWRMGFQGGKGKSYFDKKAEDSFWERRMKRKKQLKEFWEKQDQKRRALEELDKKVDLTWENYVDFLTGEKDIFMNMR